MRHDSRTADRRANACVNACAGLSDETLEGLCVQDELIALAEAAAHIALAHHQLLKSRGRILGEALRRAEDEIAGR